jgi:PAS domain S-box-containing protein
LNDIETILNFIDQPVWVVERKNGCIFAANTAATKLYGYTSEEFRGRALQDLQPHVSPEYSGETEHIRKGGGGFAVEVNAAPAEIAGKRVFVVTITDLTSWRELQDLLRQAQRMEAVGLLAGGIAHDFNNLLTIITGYSQLLLATLPEQETNRPAVEQISKASERAAALTRQLLAFSRRQTVEPKIIELGSLVSGVANMLKRLIGEDIELKLSIAPDTGRVSADPGQMEQVIMNLAVNSRDAMPEGGTLTIETRNVDLDEEYVSRHISVEPGQYVQLAVSDNGRGMDPETRARVFEPFFTTKGAGRGTGLGMSTVFGIVKQSSGNIDVYSEPGRGTSVKIYLPRVEARSAPGEGEDQAGHHTPGSETILLVEDEDNVRALVRKTLERQGYDILDAGNARDARRLSREHPGPIHLLITDVVMPRENGRQLAESLAAQRPELRVLYMSGYTDNAVLNHGVLATDAAFIQKPFSPATLSRKVRETLERGPKTLHAGEPPPVE